MERPKILYVLAHPDDESFIPSGSIAKYADLGAEIIYICATRGEHGRCGGCHNHLVPDELKMIRYHELQQACRVLGIDQLYELDYPDGHLNELKPEKPIQRLVTFLRRERPDVVITFDPTGVSNHTDHLTINRWVTQAYFLSSNPFFHAGPNEAYLPTKFYYLTVPSHHLISISNSKYREKHIDSKITTIINVADYLDKKRKAIECHQTQCFNIKRIFKFAGGLDELDAQEYYILVDCNIPGYCYEVLETDLLSGIKYQAESTV